MALTHLNPVTAEEIAEGRGSAARHRAAAIAAAEVDLLLLEHEAIGPREADLGQELAPILALVELGALDAELAGGKGGIEPKGAVYRPAEGERWAARLRLLSCRLRAAEGEEPEEGVAQGTGYVLLLHCCLDASVHVHLLLTRRSTKGSYSYYLPLSFLFCARPLVLLGALLQRALGFGYERARSLF